MLPSICASVRNILNIHLDSLQVVSLTWIKIDLRLYSVLGSLNVEVSLDCSLDIHRLHLSSKSGSTRTSTPRRASRRPWSDTEDMWYVW
jgi:hypothetical protein